MNELKVHIRKVLLFKNNKNDTKTARKIRNVYNQAINTNHKSKNHF